MPSGTTHPVIPIRRIPADVADDSSDSLYQAHAKVYPRSIDGRFARWRRAMVWVTQLVFYGMPWLVWNGRQAVLFDLDERRFFIFGLALQPQDLIYLAALLVISALALFFFTAIAGRLWCGYSCPQTVYTEIFLWVEHKIEGDRLARMRLDKAPWSLAKLVRKGGKQLVWITIAMVTGFTFVGYFTPIHQLVAESLSWSLSGWEAFWLLFYAGATYGNAGYLREQVCTYMCPYARFQSALIDADSLVVTYEAARGDPRGSRSRKAQPRTLGLGDCIDCTLCVQVCPTGIDIRNGLQNACIGCGACIDACDGVMDKMGYAPGLIRYDTGNGVAQGLTRAQRLQRLARPRVLIYGGLLAALSIAVLSSLWMRSPFGVNVLRDRGALGRIVEDGWVENVYQVKVMNRTEHSQRYRISATGLDGLALATGDSLDVPANGIEATTVRLRLPPDNAQAQRPGAHAITFVVQARAGGDARAQTESSVFFVPR